MREAIEITVTVAGTTFSGHYSLHGEGLVVSLQGGRSIYQSHFKGSPEEAAQELLRGLASRRVAEP